ncbi:LADD protein, partial [Atractosteus spatula]|nr:LADD protein [Atractosteus spatula]
SGCADGELCPCPIHGFNHWIKIGKSCFKYYGHPEPFLQAEDHCKSYEKRAHLASIHSKTENHQIYRLISARNHTYPRTWIGGYRFPGVSSFRWIDGSTWNYHNWYPGEPNNQCWREYCTEINYKGKCASRAV